MSKSTQKYTQSNRNETQSKSSGSRPTQKLTQHETKKGQSVILKRSIKSLKEKRPGPGDERTITMQSLRKNSLEAFIPPEDRMTFAEMQEELGGRRVRLLIQKGKKVVNKFYKDPKKMRVYFSRADVEEVKNSRFIERNYAVRTHGTDLRKINDKVKDSDSVYRLTVRLAITSEQYHAYQAVLREVGVSQIEDLSRFILSRINQGPGIFDVEAAKKSLDERAIVSKRKREAEAKQSEILAKLASLDISPQNLDELLTIIRKKK